MDLLTGKIRPIYFKYLSAAFGSAMITSVYSIVDMAMVGQYQGPDGTAALAVVAPIWNIIYSLGLLTGIGGSVLLSAARGAGKDGFASDGLRRQKEVLCVQHGAGFSKKNGKARSAHAFADAGRRSAQGGAALSRAGFSRRWSRACLFQGRRLAKSAQTPGRRSLGGRLAQESRELKVRKLLQHVGLLSGAA